MQTEQSSSADSCVVCRLLFSVQCCLQIEGHSLQTAQCCLQIEYHSLQTAQCCLQIESHSLQTAQCCLQIEIHSLQTSQCCLQIDGHSLQTASSQLCKVTVLICRACDNVCRYFASFADRCVLFADHVRKSVYSCLQMKCQNLQTAVFVCR